MADRPEIGSEDPSEEELAEIFRDLGFFLEMEEAESLPEPDGPEPEEDDDAEE